MVNNSTNINKTNDNHLSPETIQENLFLPLLRRFNPAEPVVEKSVIL